ncbi:hypothetical protein ACHAXS_012769 [Conticribra weissflogii]
MVPANKYYNNGPQATLYDVIYPRQYVAFRAPVDSGIVDEAVAPIPAVTIDGNMEKPFWEGVPWTEDFVDIATDTEPKFRTKVKMLWDDNFLYVGAIMEETDVWGTLTMPNSVIFHDNDFEINALGTTWSLRLNKPYDDNGGEDSARINPDGFDMTPPLQSAVAIYPHNAINLPDIPNTHWTVEIALPLRKLMENNPRAQKPSDGVFWRVNFSRVQWGVKVVDGKYEKAPSCQSCANPGQPAEDNWVWSKQGEVKMHLPERWGILQFSHERPGSRELEEKAWTKYYEEWESRCAAMALYYAQKRFHEEKGLYTENIELLKLYAIDYFPICEDAKMLILLVNDGFEAKVSISLRTATVNHDRHLTVSTAAIDKMEH